MPRLTVVVSQGRSVNPQKRQLEDGLVTALENRAEVAVVVVPHLYDLQPDGPAVQTLRGLAGDLVVCAWLYPRAVHWTLDRHGIHGHVGQTEMDSGEADEGDDEAADAAAEAANEKSRVIDERPPSDRTIYALDLRWQPKPQGYLDEIQRILDQQTAPDGTGSLMQWIGGRPAAEPLDRYLHPTNDYHQGGDRPAAGKEQQTNGTAAATGNLLRVEEQSGRRWYPVIDYSRCTNCLECLDFCLFGVYGVDRVETILVEQPDNCRKGCPACSRVCPENAIIFPEHKTPAIAGSPLGSAGAFKIDLSKLFGAPEADALEVAVAERDRELLAAGRDAVGLSVGIPKRQADRPEGAKDELDQLMDQLDTLDL